MPLMQVDMISGLNKIETAIEFIVAFQPPEKPYQVADSGGKDSTVIVNLTKLAEPRLKRKPDYVYCVSPIDPPEIHQFLKDERSETQWDYHARGWWPMVYKKGLPTMRSRWCCEVIKEAGGDGRVVIVGNRAAESQKRRRQKCFEESRKKGKYFLRPILNWSDKEVWEYIKLYSLPYCSLYDEGFERIGCVMCPLANRRNRMREMERFPKIAKLWRLSCDKIVERRLATKGYSNFTPEELWDWWISF